MSTEPLRVEVRRRGGRTVPVALAGAAFVRPRVLGGHGEPLRVALVQTAACLLAGDELALEIDVGPGAALDLVELAATIAHHGRGGAAARWTARVRVGPGGRLRWPAAPFIVAEGACVLRALEVDVAAGGAALLRDTLVLGRAGELPGRLLARTELHHDGRALLVEELDTSDLELLRSPAVMGAAKVLDTLALVGLAPEPSEGAWRLAGDGLVRTRPASSADVADAEAAGLLRAWSALLAPQDPIAAARSAIRSSAASMPQLSRTRSGATAAAEPSTD